MFNFKTRNTCLMSKRISKRISKHKSVPLFLCQNFLNVFEMFSMCLTWISTCKLSKHMSRVFKLIQSNIYEMPDYRKFTHVQILKMSTLSHDAGAVNREWKTNGSKKYWSCIHDKELDNKNGVNAWATNNLELSTHCSGTFKLRICVRKRL